MDGKQPRHLTAASLHDDAEGIHRRAAARWVVQGNADLAAEAWWNAEIERVAARAERDWAGLRDARRAAGSHRDVAARLRASAQRTRALAAGHRARSAQLAEQSDAILSKP